MGQSDSGVVKAAKTTMILPHPHKWVTMTNECLRLVVIQPHTQLNEKHQLTWKNGVAITEPDVPLRVLVDNVSGIPKRVVGNQTI